MSVDVGFQGGKYKNMPHSDRVIQNPDSGKISKRSSIVGSYNWIFSMPSNLIPDSRKTNGGSRLLLIEGTYSMSLITKIMILHCMGSRIVPQHPLCKVISMHSQGCIDSHLPLSHYSILCRQ